MILFLATPISPSNPDGANVASKSKLYEYIRIIAFLDEYIVDSAVLQVLESLQESENREVQETDQMECLLRDILDNSIASITLLTGPKEVGKTVTLLWLYKKLVLARKSVLVLSPKIILRDIENIELTAMI